MLYNVHEKDLSEQSRKLLTIVAIIIITINIHEHVVCGRRQATIRAPEPLSLSASRKMDLRLRKCRQMLTLCGRGHCSDVKAAANT